MLRGRSHRVLPRVLPRALRPARDRDRGLCRTFARRRDGAHGRPRGPVAGRAAGAGRARRARRQRALVVACHLGSVGQLARPAAPAEPGRQAGREGRAARLSRGAARPRHARDGRGDRPFRAPARRPARAQAPDRDRPLPDGGLHRRAAGAQRGARDARARALGQRGQAHARGPRAGLRQGGAACRGADAGALRPLPAARAAHPGHAPAGRVPLRETQDRARSAKRQTRAARPPVSCPSRSRSLCGSRRARRRGETRPR